ncbi:MAG: cupin domain-containing protein [Methylococcaceae bacterium]|nr:cupin domain-containing protein [Methylococcaceae bacterium]
MSKSTESYWNPLLLENKQCWKPINGMNGLVEELTLSIDEESGDYTRLTRFLAGADTTPLGSKSHDYPEEVMIIQGRLYDVSFEKWLETGTYASRPPGEKHGPFMTSGGCVVLEMSFPGQAINDASS